jgi:hypothetical protein
VRHAASPRSLPLTWWDILLIGIDEEGTLAALNAHRKEVVDPLIAQRSTSRSHLQDERRWPSHRVRSIVDAVRCAVFIQQRIECRNANVDIGRRIRFRMGINVGDVIIDWLLCRHRPCRYSNLSRNLYARQAGLEVPSLI